MNDPKADRRESPACASRLPVGLRGSYQLPEAPQTLREGLAEYYRVNPGLSEPREIRDSRSAAYFHSHDTTHVVFGTHTGALHEVATDWWTFFGVDIRVRDSVSGFFATDESAAIMQQFGSPKQSAQLFLHGLRILPEVRRRHQFAAQHSSGVATVRGKYDVFNGFGVRQSDAESQLSVWS